VGYACNLFQSNLLDSILFFSCDLIIYAFLSSIYRLYVSICRKSRLIIKYQLINLIASCADDETSDTELYGRIGRYQGVLLLYMMIILLEVYFIITAN